LAHSTRAMVSIGSKIAPPGRAVDFFPPFAERPEAC
jgi:hypothetical protein